MHIVQYGDKTVENIETILSKGFETYTKNLNISIPFVLNLAASGIVFVVIFIFGLLYVFGSSLDSLKNAQQPEEVFGVILPLIMNHIPEIALLIVGLVILITLVQAFFMAGAIGMAQQAAETGKTDLSVMLSSGKKHFINLFLAELIVGLISLAGMVFIVPGAMKVDFSQMLSSENPQGILLLMGGILLWIVYLILISIVLAVFRYAIVIDNLGPIESITKAFEFFNKHKMDVFLLLLVVITLAIILMILDHTMGYIPIIKYVWSLISFIISLIIIPPLTEIWWVRLYMERTGKKLYFDDLLAHPNEIEQMR